MHRLRALAPPSFTQHLRGALPACKRMAGTECCASPPVHYPEHHQAIIPPPELNGTDVTSWLDGQTAAASGQEHRRTIFCNRTLDMSSMEAIGFDMVRNSIVLLAGGPHVCAAGTLVWALTLSYHSCAWHAQRFAGSSGRQNGRPNHAVEAAKTIVLDAGLHTGAIQARDV